MSFGYNKSQMVNQRTKYRSVLLTKRGGPDVLEIIENEFLSLENEQVLIKVQACGVGQTDIAMRYGYYPFAPKIPFIPGYEIVGKIESIGKNISKFKVGDIVAALTVYGGYSEYIYLHEKHLVKLPDNLDPSEVVALILNYTTAYQMLTRSAKIAKGDKILINGASGGVGTALLDLGKLFKLKIYGTASVQKHDILTQKEAIPIDYKTKDFVEVILQNEPEGLDFVFDGIGSLYINKSFSVIRKGGKLVEYGYPDFPEMLKGLLRIFLLNSLPNGKKCEFYGISGSYKKNRITILRDLSILIELLAAKQIKPIIYKRMPLMNAAEANRILESGSVTGKIVLVAN